MFLFSPNRIRGKLKFTSNAGIPTCDGVVLYTICKKKIEFL